MFDWMFEKDDVATTEKEIRRLHEELAWYDPTTEEYRDILARLKDLQELHKMEHEPAITVSGDTIVKCLCMLAFGTVVVFREELVGPVTSKMLNLVPKML